MGAFSLAKWRHSMPSKARRRVTFENGTGTKFGVKIFILRRFLLQGIKGPKAHQC